MTGDEFARLLGDFTLLAESGDGRRGRKVRTPNADNDE